MQLCDIFLQEFISLIVLLLDQLHNHFIYLGLRFGRNRKRRIAAKILVMQLFHGNHTDAVCHSVTGNHRSCRLCRTLNIICRTGGTGMENKFLRTTPSGKCCNFIFQLFLGVKIMIAFFLYLHGIAQGSRGSRNNGNLVHRSGILLQSRYQSMADFMIRNNQLLLIRHNLIFLLISRNNHFNGLFKIRLNYSLSAGTNRTKRRLIDDVGKLCTGGTGSSLRYGFQIHIVGHLNLLRMYL